MRLIETIEIELDRKRFMVFDHEALRLAERELNKFRGLAPAAWMSIDEYVGTAQLRRAIAGFFPADFLQAMLWAALVKEDPLITVQTAGALITDRGYIDAKIVECLDKCWPKKDDSDAGDELDDGKKKPAGQPTGLPIGASPESSSH